MIARRCGSFAAGAGKTWCCRQRSDPAVSATKSAPCMDTQHNTGRAARGCSVEASAEDADSGALAFAVRAPVHEDAGLEA